ncbi:MAG: hypothetical protein WKF87_01950 [Chryseolinea sp.]
MKKLIAVLAVTGFAFAFVACGKKAETAETTVDSAATSTEEVYDSAATVPVDSTTAADSTAL